MYVSARRGVAIVRSRTPRAFGELQESTQAYRTGIDGGPVISVDAPHAADVERGSPPHKPNMDKLIAWVRLRGMQGLTKGGGLRSRFAKSDGLTTRANARSIARGIRSAQMRARSARVMSYSRKAYTALVRANNVAPDRHRVASGRYTPTDVIKRIAGAIAASIEKHGTRPHWYVRDSLPELEADLAARVSRAVGRT